MENLTWSLTVLFFATIVTYFIAARIRRKLKYNLPPGPFSFPIIGSVIQLAKIDSVRPMAAIQILGKTYGNIISLQMGSVYHVAVNGIDEIKELSNHPDFLDRSKDNIVVDKTLGLPLGQAFSETENEFWASTRQVSHKLTREYGFGKSGPMYNLIIEELKDFMEKWKTLCSKSMDGTAKIHIEKQFSVILLNVIWTLETGSRFHTHDDPKMKRFSDLGNKWLIGGRFGAGLTGLFPIFLKLFPKWTGYEKHVQVSKDMFEFFMEIIEERIKIGEYKHSPSNFIDSFLQLIENNNRDNLISSKSKPGELLKSIYTKENLIGILQDFAIAGNDTSSNTLNFIIRYLVQYPSKQKKLHDEIDRQIGHNRLVTLEDKPKLLFTQAVIFEGLRLATVLPTLPRRTVRDTKFRGFDIPKGTVVIPNYYGTHFDETIWENPETFRPERFLNSKHTELINTDKILAFGTGKRNCVGENVAKTTLFIVLTTLVQQFRFEVDPDYGIPDSNTIEGGITRDTEPFNIIIRQKY